MPAGAHRCRCLPHGNGGPVHHRRLQVHSLSPRRGRDSGSVFSVASAPPTLALVRRVRILLLNAAGIPARAGAVARHGSILSRAGSIPPSVTARPPDRVRPALHSTIGSRAWYPTPALGATMEWTMNGLKTLTTLAGTVAIALTAWTYSAPITAAQSAPTVDPALYGGMRWRSLGARRPLADGRRQRAASERVRSPAPPAAASGRPRTAATTWRPTPTDAKMAHVLDSVSLAVCQSNPDVVYIGGGETQFRQYHPG